VDSVLCFVDIYLLDSYLYGGQRYPPFEQPGQEAQPSLSAAYFSLGLRACEGLATVTEIRAKNPTTEPQNWGDWGSVSSGSWHKRQFFKGTMSLFFRTRLQNLKTLAQRFQVKTLVIVSLH